MVSSAFIEYGMTDIWDELRNRPEKGAERLISEYSDRLYKTAYRLCSNSATAEDLVCRTFIQALSHQGCFESEKKYFAWLCTILVNFYRQDLRRSSSSALVYGEDLSEVESASPTPSEEVVGLDEAALVKKAVGLLSPPLREVVALYYFDGLGLQELANILGLPLGTVKFRLHAARKKLCEHVTRLFGEKRDSL